MKRGERTGNLYRRTSLYDGHVAGALVCALAWRPLGEMTAMLLGGSLVVLIRGLSAHYRWNLPRAHE